MNSRAFVSVISHSTEHSRIVFRPTEQWENMSKIIVDISQTFFFLLYNLQRALRVLWSLPFESIYILRFDTKTQTNFVASNN